MTSPQARLSSRSWRLVNSTWMVPAIALLGVGTWASFLYIGAKAKNAVWLALAGVYLAAAGVLLYLTPGRSDVEPVASETTLFGGIASGVWISGIAVALAVNRKWLTWRSNHTAPWYAAGQTPGAPANPGGSAPVNQVDSVLSFGSAGGSTTGHERVATSPPPPPTAPPPPHAATPSPAYLPPSPSPEPPPQPQASPGLVDVNSAPAEELQLRLGLPQDVATQVVARRQVAGGFSHVNELVTIAGMPPHLFTRVRDLVSVSSPQAPRPPQTPRPPQQPQMPQPPVGPSPDGGSPAPGRRLDL